MPRQFVEITAASARQQNSIGALGIWQSAHDDFLGHQRSDFDADIDDAPLEFRLHARQNSFESRFSQMPSEKQDFLGHTCHAHAVTGLGAGR
jgi:hypothetical protein